MPKENSKILNMYEKIPKEFLDKVDNPNFHLHQLKLLAVSYVYRCPVGQW